MKFLLRKIFIISLITAFFYNAIGLEILLAYILVEVKAKVGEFSDNKEIHTVIIINSKNINLYSRINKTEFLYDGIMYDVHSQRISPAGLLIDCSRDLKEQQAITAFSKSTGKTGSSDLPRTSKRDIIKKTIKSYLITSGINQIYPEYSPQPGFDLINSYKQPLLKKFSPPPQLT